MEFSRETGVAVAAGAAKLWTLDHDGGCVFFIFRRVDDVNALQRCFCPNEERVAIDPAHAPDARQDFSEEGQFVESYLDRVPL